MSRLPALMLSALALAGCPTAPDEGGHADAGAAQDAGAATQDAGRTDAGLTDAGMDDAGPTDAGPTDAGPTDAGASDAGLLDAGSSDAGPPCHRTLCIGPLGDGAGIRADLGTLCSALPDPITHCTDGACSPLFPVSLAGNYEVGTDALRDALDSNMDGLVNGEDQACTVTLVGYSYGVRSVFVLADAVGAYGAGHNHVDHVVLLDPKALPSAPPLSMPATVNRAWVYRRSVVNAGGCSADLPNGPFAGDTVSCTDDMHCTLYDYSVLPDAMYTDNSGLFDGATYTASDLDHCTLVRAAAGAVVANANGMDGSGLPPAP